MNLEENALWIDLLSRKGTTAKQSFLISVSLGPPMCVCVCMFTSLISVMYSFSLLHQIQKGFCNRLWPNSKRHFWQITKCLSKWWHQFRLFPSLSHFLSLYSLPIYHSCFSFQHWTRKYYVLNLIELIISTIFDKLLNGFHISGPNFGIFIYWLYIFLSCTHIFYDVHSMHLCPHISSPFNIAPENIICNESNYTN